MAGLLYCKLIVLLHVRKVGKIKNVELRKESPTEQEAIKKGMEAGGIGVHL